jgi:carboxypeptidase Taq (EC:3.4.17.19). Metallo peptidase. MEROPS family M32
MTEHIHQHGQRYKTPALVERATGEPISAEPFVEYLREKFERLYDI